jgi:hypothetical protein
MVSNLVFYQLVLIAVVWLFLMLSGLWPAESTAAGPRTPKPLMLTFRIEALILVNIHL